MKLWIVGQYKNGDHPNIVWELAGVFDSEEKAIAACIDENMFVASMVLNQISPRETTPFEDCRYPITAQASA